VPLQKFKGGRVPAIIPYILKDRPAKGFAYLLKYADIEACFVHRVREVQRVIYLDVHFSLKQRYWKQDRDRLEAEGQFTLVQCGYTPGQAPPYGPWQEQKSPVVVSVGIYAVPQAVITSARIDRSTVRRVFQEQVESVTHESLTAKSWRTAVALLVSTRSLECTSAMGPAYVQAGSETIRVVSLDDVKPTLA
jgi:hypothetical protein